MKEYEAAVEWRAFELHPEIPPEGKAIPKRPGPEPSLAQQMAQEAGLPMASRDMVSNVRLALEAAEFARAAGAFDQLHRAILKTYWADNENIGDPQVLVKTAAGVGLDGKELLKALATRAYEAEVEAQLQDARARGVTVVPTFIFDGKYVIQGAAPYGVFQMVMEKFVKAQPPP